MMIRKLFFALLLGPAMASGGYAQTNTVYGTGAMPYATGIQNSAFGYVALAGNTTGESNSAFGVAALANNTSGNVNAAFGMASLRHNTTGSYNAAFGPDVLYANTTGRRNSGLAYDALHLNTTGSENVSIGFLTLYSNTTGNANTALGYCAGGPRYYCTEVGSIASSPGNITGSYNTYLGYNAGPDGNYSNSIAIGYNARVTASNQTIIGNDNTADTTLRGVVHVDSLCIGATCINETQLQAMLGMVE